MPHNDDILDDSMLPHCDLFIIAKKESSDSIYYREIINNNDSDWQLATETWMMNLYYSNLMLEEDAVC